LHRYKLVRHPPTTWSEAREMTGLFGSSISSSLERSLGLEAGTLPGGGGVISADAAAMMQIEDDG
jgi:hypothetical protein